MLITFTIILLTAGCIDVEIDSCLDNGGSYDYRLCKCDLEKNHKLIVNNKC